jgi:hypothetical protein
MIHVALIGMETDENLAIRYLASACESYEIADPRAELLFRIANTAFHRRNLEEDGLAMLNLALRMNVEILRLFYPASWDDGIHERAVALSERLGRSSVRKLREIRAFAASVDLADVDTIRAYAVESARSIHREEFALLTELREERDLHGQPRRTCYHGN